MGWNFLPRFCDSACDGAEPLFVNAREEIGKEQFPAMIHSRESLVKQIADIKRRADPVRARFFS